MARVVVATGMPQGLLDRSRPTADWCLQWDGHDYNVLVNISELREVMTSEPPPLLRDILDIAAAALMSDIAVLRGSNEAWTRDIDLLIPVREPHFWEENKHRLTSILHTLTRDNFRLTFCAHEPAEEELLRPSGDAAVEVDCVSALSGGLDSLAGAVMLLRAGRKPLFVTHQSGNPQIRTAQSAIRETLEELWPGTATFAGVLLQPRKSGRFAFPEPREREISRRSRSLLFMALLAVAAHATEVEEAYFCDNGVLTVALPLSDGRIGSLSTRSTHPLVLSDFNALLEAAGVKVTVVNPFVYQTKAELIREILRPVLTPAQIQASVSCWMTGRRQRPCGGCIPCLLRRVSMLAAGAPDEAYEMDILAEPTAYRGTEAYGNLTDLLTQVMRVRSMSEAELLMQWPQLLDLASAGVAVADVIAMYRRYAEEVWNVMHEHFPTTAALMTTGDQNNQGTTE